jgi:hypothetical protein
MSPTQTGVRPRRVRGLQAIGMSLVERMSIGLRATHAYGARPQARRAHQPRDAAPAHVPAGGEEQLMKSRTAIACLTHLEEPWRGPYIGGREHLPGNAIVRELSVQSETSCCLQRTLTVSLLRVRSWRRKTDARGV